MQVDLTDSATEALDRAEKKQLQPGEWRIRIRTSGDPEEPGKHVVEDAEGVEDPMDLQQVWASALSRHEGSGCVYIHLECIQSGKPNPFYSKPVKVREPEMEVEPTEGGAMMALSRMGISANATLERLVKSLGAELANSRQAEMRMVALLAEMKANMEAADDSAKWEAIAAAAQPMIPMLIALVQQWVATENAKAERERDQAQRDEQDWEAFQEWRAAQEGTEPDES